MQPAPGWKAVNQNCADTEPTESSKGVCCVNANNFDNIHTVNHASKLLLFLPSKYLTWTWCAGCLTGDRKAAHAKRDNFCFVWTCGASLQMLYVKKKKDLTTPVWMINDQHITAIFTNCSK